MKVRVLTAVAALALAGAIPSIAFDKLTTDPPIVRVETWVQHVNVFTS
ncbi:hypothetical protein AB0J35_25620 [Nonomuraea angiospora]